MDPYSSTSITPKKMVQSLYLNRRLICQMAKREVIGRYRGSVMGLAWSFFNPLIMLVVYTFVFSVVFKARWGTGSDSKTEFALALFIGMIVHGLLAECVTKAPGLIVGNASYVKKVIFPLEILPWIAMASTLFHTMVSLLVWGLFFVIVNQTFHWTAVFLPLLFLPLIFLTMGLTWFLASFGVYLRDVGQITGVFVMVLMFMSPVFYPISNIPEKYHPILYANPLTFIIEQARAVLMWGQVMHWEGFVILLVSSFVVAWLGFAWFQKTRRGFADVL